MTFWGFPAETSHDASRFPKGKPGEPAGCAGSTTAGCIKEPMPAAITVHPLTDNPTTCTGKELPTSLEVQTYQKPEERSEAQSSYPETTGCYFETFNPVLFAGPTINETDSASGLDIELTTTQTEGFAASPSEIKSAIVTLPEGLTINPDAADGQSMCTNAEANFGTEGPAECPDSAKIGTVEIHSAALNGTLEGSVYIGQPEPGNQYRLFEIASGFGMNVKLLGTFSPQPPNRPAHRLLRKPSPGPLRRIRHPPLLRRTGPDRDPDPLHPLSDLRQVLPLGRIAARSRLEQALRSRIRPPRRRLPGRSSPLQPEPASRHLQPGRRRLFLLHPEAQPRRRRSVPRQAQLHHASGPDRQPARRHLLPRSRYRRRGRHRGRSRAGRPQLPRSSEIGSSNVAAGPGTHPFHAAGRIYFAGPFKGAPLSLVAITPALAGPYDYGTVVVRVALHIDPLDAHVIADSETVPEIIGGIPIRMREIQVNIDKPNFMINPTNCSPFSVTSEGVGDQGTVANFSSSFQAVNCSSSPFAPKLSITQLGGHKFTQRSKDPSLAIELNTRAGDANIKSLTVTLPKAFEIDQRHLGNICDRSELASDQCAGRQPIGEATTNTPLLEKPLKGPVYAVSGFGLLPHLAFILGGQVTLMPEAESSSVKNGRLKTVVPVVPDAPIGNFRFTLFGGAQGYLSNTQSLCSAPTVSTIEFDAQNGKTLTQQVKAKTACKGKSVRKKAKLNSRRRHH